MARAFIQNGLWRPTLADRIDPRVQRQATLRVSIAAAVGTLLLAYGHGGTTQAPASITKGVVISAPEIIIAKLDERVPAIFAAPSPFRRRAATEEMPTMSAGKLETVATTPTSAPVRDAEVLDAGMIRTGAASYRLAGIALPENGRMCRRLDGLAVPCADRAHSYLQLLVKGRKVDCEQAPQVSDGPLEGNCRVGDSDIAEQLVRQGWAKAGDKPEERFMLAEAAAKRQKLGMWRE